MSGGSSRGPGNSRPTVSIIIPCYNYGRFLAEAVESALAQTRPADEIVIIDDGSTDDSVEVANRFRQSPTVRILRQPNQGAVVACNRAIRSSSGTFFLRVDADDRLDPRHLEYTVPLLEADPQAGYVYTSYLYFGDREGQVAAIPFDRRLLTIQPFILGTSLIRRSAFDEVGGYSMTMADAYEDWDFYLALAERGWHGVPLRSVLYHYRQHGRSRNTMSFKKWLGLMIRLYRRHRNLYSVPLALFLSRAVLDRIWQRTNLVIMRDLARRRSKQRSASDLGSI